MSTGHKSKNTIYDFFYRGNFQDDIKYSGGKMRLLEKRIDVAGKLYRTLALWHMRYTTRKELARLDERMLKDIGLYPGDQISEADKPFWKK